MKIRDDFDAAPRLHQEPEVEMAAIERRIAWLLTHHATSNWLRGALQSALAEDPVAVSNDVEVLRHLLVPRAIAQAMIVTQG